MIIPTEDGELPINGAERGTAQQRAARIVRDVLRQRSKGVVVTDSKLLSLYPELADELHAELELADRIHRAMLTAERAGPPAQRLRILSESELEQPIELSSESGDD